MRSEAECGKPLGTHKNRTRKAARAELTVEYINATEGCRGVSVKIYDAEQEKPVEAYFVEEAGGPDLYEVPPQGRLEVCCGVIMESEPHGKCRARWILRWI